MKKNFITLAAVMVVIMSVTFLSCTKEAEVIVEEQATNETATLSNCNDGFQVKNGVLYFETPEVYLSTFNKLSILTDQDLINWETSLGFTSLRTIISNEYLKIDTLSEQKDVKNLLDENSYLQLITNSQNELEIVEPISREFQNICNKDFIFVVSNQIYKIVGNMCFIFRSNESSIKRVVCHRFHRFS